MIGLDQILNKCLDGIIAGCTIAWQHIGYVIDYKKNIQNLLDESEKFENELTRIDGRVKRAKNDGEIPEADVMQWIESANGIKGDVEALLVDATRENKWCLKWCPNVSWRYKLGKESKEKTARVISLKDIGKQYMTIEVAQRAPPLKVGYNFSQGYEAFDSRAEIFEEIMKALANPCNKMIGLYGPGGVGKTTMAIEVGKLAKQNGLFDDVAMATLSQPLNEKAVKEKIALQLGLTLDGSAYRLYHRLNNGKKNLVILDDVWEPLNLADIEIPITDGNKGCKVVITSRKSGFCQKMSVPVDQEDSLNEVLAEPEEWTKEFLIGVLQKPDAWALFKKVATISMDSEIPYEAKEVCDKCGGLPVAIRAVAAALKGKGKHAWKDALRQLKNYKIKEIVDIDQNLLISLKWSYDWLEPKDARSCFLLCSLFPEDAEISIDELVRYSIGMRLLDQNWNTFDEVRDRILAMVNVLKTSCLLLDDTNESVVKMHDIIRDVAISIAEDEKRYLVKHGIEKWPEKGSYEHYSAISLRFTANIHEFPNELECRGLHTLVLKCNNDSPTNFPNNFFNGMENNLEVLDLSKIPIKSLPSSLPTLVKLRMLCLNGGRLMTKIALLGILGSLRNLEILSLTGMEKVLFHGEDGTGFSELQFLKSQPQIPPGSFCNLCELRVQNCQFKFLFTHSIARGLEQLQHLEIGDCEDMEDIIRNERQGDEEEIIFHHLKKMVLKNLPNLRSFYSSMKNTSITEANNSNPSRPLFCEKVAFPALEGLTIEYVENISGIIGDKQLKLPVQQEENESLWNLPRLRDLRIVYCSKLKAIVVANKEGAAHEKPLIFRDLHSLYFSGLKNLKSFFSICGSKAEEEISKPQPLFNKKVAFPALEYLKIVCVQNISGIIGDKQLKLPVQQEENESFWNLPRLRDLCVKNCFKLKAIVVANKEGGAHDKPLIFRDVHSLYLSDLDNLKSFYSIGGSEVEEEISKPQPLFNEKVIFPALEELRIDRLPKITELWYRKLLPSESFRQLRYMTIRNCQELKVIVLENGEEVKVENNNNIISFPQLTSLTLEHLQSLESFCTSRSETQSLFTSQVAFPTLEELLISGVPKITEIWGKQFPSELKVNESEKLMNVVQSKNLRKLSENAKKKAMAQENKRNDDVIVFPRLRTVRLDNLQNLNFFCRTRRFETQTLFNHQIACPELRVLAISWVPNITDVWDKKLLPTGSFCQLREVRIEGCHKLVNVILSNMLPRLQNLTELSVQYCPMVEEILSEKWEEKADAEAEENILFPQLKTLELGSLENLKSFCTSRLAAQHFFKHPGAFASLKELHICNLPNITEIWGKQLLPVPKTDAKSFEKLAVVNATWCEKLVNVIPSSMFPRLKNLKSIYVKGCPEMEVIVSKKVNATVNGDIIFFPQLSSLSIDKLYNLKSFCSSSTSAEAQPLFNDQVVFPVLEDLFINRVQNITKIWDKLHSRESFCLLKCMMIADCEKLVNVVPSYMLPQLQNLEVLNAYSCQKMLAIVSKEEGKEKDVDENIILFPKLTTSNLKSLDNLTTFYTQPFLNCQVYGDELMASPTKAKMYHHTKLNVEPKPEVLSSAPAKLDESNDDESKDSQHSDDSDEISGDTMDLNDAGHDINTSFNTPNAERGIIIAQPSEPDIMDVLIKENQKTWGLVRQWEAKYKQLEESWELRARVIAAIEAKLFDQSGPSNMDIDIKNCMEWKDTEIQRLTKLVINLECEKTIVQDLFDDQSVHIITQVEAQKAHNSLKKHPIVALEHIISPPSKVKRIKQKVRKEHRLDEFEYPNLPGQKKGKEVAEEQYHVVQIAQDLDKHLQKKHPTKYEKLTLNNKLKVWANMSKLNKQKVQNLHKNGGDELLVWRGDSKTKDVYFDDIIYIIKEESITNNVIDAYGEILLEQQGLVNPSLDDSAFIFTSTCLKIMQEYPPHKRNKLIDVYIKEYQGQRFLIFPIHDNFHWTIVVYDVKDNVWRHYNSLRPRPSIHDPHIDKAQIVRDYIEAVVRNIGPSSSLWTKLSGQNTSQPIISVDICPQQASDSVDCGPAVCYIMRAHVYREEIVDRLTHFEWCQLRDSLVHIFLNHRKTVQCENL